MKRRGIISADGDQTMERRGSRNQSSRSRERGSRSRSWLTSVKSGRCAKSSIFIKWSSLKAIVDRIVGHEPFGFASSTALLLSSNGWLGRLAEELHDGGPIKSRLRRDQATIVGHLERSWHTITLRDSAPIMAINSLPTTASNGLKIGPEIPFKSMYFPSYFLNF